MYFNNESPLKEQKFSPMKYKSEFDTVEINDTEKTFTKPKSDVEGKTGYVATKVKSPFRLYQDFK